MGPKPGQKSLPEREEDASGASSPGLTARLARWWRGPDKPPLEEAPSARIPSHRATGKTEQKPGAAVADEKSEQPWQTAPPASPADRVPTRGILEGLLPELEAARRQLQEVREAAQARVLELEAELDQHRAAAEKSLTERIEIEAQTDRLRKSVAALERQLQEERASPAARREEREGERSHLESRIRFLEEELKAARSALPQLEAARDQSRAQCAQLESRVRALEEELEAGPRRRRKKKEGAESAVAEWEGERQESRMLSTRFESRIQLLEDALVQAQEHSKNLELQLAAQKALEQQPAASAEAGAPPTVPPGRATRALSAEAVEALYHKTMVPLTVLLASADLVLMNPKLDPKLRDTAQEIKKQGQTLLDIIKTSTLSPEAQKTN